MSEETGRDALQAALDAIGPVEPATFPLATYNEAGDLMEILFDNVNFYANWHSGTPVTTLHEEGTDRIVGCHIEGVALVVPMLAAAPAMLAELERLEWSDWSRFDGVPYRCCLVCGGKQPGQKVTPFVPAGCFGHKVDCSIAAAIRAAKGGGE